MQFRGLADYYRFRRPSMLNAVEAFEDVAGGQAEDNRAAVGTGCG